jgi:hypothetical protein
LTLLSASLLGFSASAFNLAAFSFFSASYLSDEAYNLATTPLFCLSSAS